MAECELLPANERPEELMKCWFALEAAFGSQMRLEADNLNDRSFLG